MFTLTIEKIQYKYKYKSDKMLECSMTVKIKVFPSIPCSLAVMGGMACTPSSRSSSLAHAAWPSFCGGTWVRIAPSSETAGQGLWPVPV